MPEAERHAKEQQGIAAWKTWMERHHDALVGNGGPLGKTKKVTRNGVQDVTNELGGFAVVRAESHETAGEDV